MAVLDIGATGDVAGERRGRARSPDPASFPAKSGASQRRSLDERLFVRFPSLIRLLGGAFMRLPPRSRLRRLLLARLCGRHTRQLTVGTSTGPYGLRSRERISPQRRPDGSRPGAKFSTGMTDTASPGETGSTHSRTSGGTLRRSSTSGIGLLVTTQRRGRGSGSGVGVSKPVFQLFTLRRGLVVRQEDFADRDQALEAAGLSE